MDVFARRDVKAMREINDPEVEVDWSASAGVEARVYRGFDSVLRFYTGYFEAFTGIVWEELSFIEAGEYIVVPNMSRSWGRDGIEVFARSTLVFTVRARKITRICLCQEQDKACPLNPRTRRIFANSTACRRLLDPCDKSQVAWSSQSAKTRTSTGLLAADPTTLPEQ